MTLQLQEENSPWGFRIDLKIWLDARKGDHSCERLVRCPEWTSSNFGPGKFSVLCLIPLFLCTLGLERKKRNGGDGRREERGRRGRGREGKREEGREERVR